MFKSYWHQCVQKHCLYCQLCSPWEFLLLRCPLISDYLQCNCGYLSVSWLFVIITANVTFMFPNPSSKLTPKLYQHNAVFFPPSKNMFPALSHHWLTLNTVKMWKTAFFGNEVSCLIKQITLNLVGFGLYTLFIRDCRGSLRRLSSVIQTIFLIQWQKVVLK